MNVLIRFLVPGCLALCVAGAFAADEMKKDAMAKDTMTMEQCKDHIAMSRKDGMKKDDAAMKKDALCAEMARKDAMTKKDDAMMKKDDMAAPPMKK